MQTNVYCSIVIKIHHELFCIFNFVIFNFLLLFGIDIILNFFWFLFYYFLFMIFKWKPVSKIIIYLFINSIAISWLVMLDLSLILDFWGMDHCYIINMLAWQYKLAHFLYFQLIWIFIFTNLAIIFFKEFIVLLQIMFSMSQISKLWISKSERWVNIGAIK